MINLILKQIRIRIRPDLVLKKSLTEKNESSVFAIFYKEAWLPIRI